MNRTNISSCSLPNRLDSDKSALRIQRLYSKPAIIFGLKRTLIGRLSQMMYAVLIACIERTFYESHRNKVSIRTIRHVISIIRHQFGNQCGSTLLLSLLFFVFWSQPTIAQINWSNPGDGFWHQGSNWNGGNPPSSSDIARFGLNSSSKVSWDSASGNTSTAALQVATGNVSFESVGGQIWQHAVSGTTLVEANGRLNIGTQSPNQFNLASNGLFVQSNGTVNVAFGSLLTSNSDLGVGYSGLGTMSVVQGCKVGGATTVVGWNTSSEGSLLVNGNGSQLSSTGLLHVAYSGNGTMNVEAAGAVTNTIGVVGTNAGSIGIVNVTGAGSVWSNSSYLEIANSGSGSLNVLAGGVVSSESGWLGRSSGTTGHATITGTDSQWINTTTLVVGDFGNGELNAYAGGVINNSIGYLGFNSGSNGVATINGVGSEWNNASALRIGTSGSGVMNVEAGGYVTNTSGAIGSGAGANGLANVTGNGSWWKNDTFIQVGGGGNGTLNIEDGGLVTNTIGILGANTGSNGSATIRGLGSTWNNSGALRVGASGNGTMNVLAGGVVNNTESIVGISSGSLGRAIVSGAGSEWNSTLGLNVGRDNGSNGALNVENGGLVSSASGFVGRNSGSIGQATIMGNGSQWNSAGVLVIGDRGSGTLNIHTGGLVVSGSGSIGDEAGSVGLATVSGANSQWSVSGNFVVGSGGTGTLNINNDALLSVTGITTIGANGIINLDDGQFDGNEIANAGLISGRGIIRAPGGFENSGALNFSAGLADVVGDVNNLPGGSIVTANSGTTTFNNDVVNNGTEIQTAANSETIIVGDYTGDGHFTGLGTVSFQGDVRPGNSPAIVDFGGQVVFGSAAVPHFELGGMNPGDYDQMRIAGNLTINNSILDVSLINGFSVEPNMQFLILKVLGEINGNFFGLSEGGTIGNFGGSDLFITYNGIGSDAGIGLYSLTAVPEPSSLLPFLAIGLTKLFLHRKRRG